METVINFLVGWAELITAVFTDHTLSGALTLVAAIFLYNYLIRSGVPFTKWNYKGNKKVCAFITLLIWLAIVPILGFVFNVIGGVRDLILFIYSKFEDQPIYVAIVFFITILSYFVWGFIAKHKAPKPVSRCIIVAALFLIFISLSVPIIKSFSNSSSPTASVQSNNQIQPTPKSGAAD